MQLDTAVRSKLRSYTHQLMEICSLETLGQISAQEANRLYKSAFASLLEHRGSPS